MATSYLHYNLHKFHSSENIFNGFLYDSVFRINWGLANMMCDLLKTRNSEPLTICLSRRAFLYLSIRGILYTSSTYSMPKFSILDQVGQKLEKNASCL